MWYQNAKPVSLTYSIMLLLSHFLLLSFQCRPSWGEQNKTDAFSSPSLMQTETHTHTCAGVHMQRKENLSESALQGLSGLTEVKMWPDTLKSFLYVPARLLAAICCCETKPNEHGRLRLTSWFCPTPKHSICPEQLRGANVAGWSLWNRLMVMIHHSRDTETLSHRSSHLSYLVV